MQLQLQQIEKAAKEAQEAERAIEEKIGMLTAPPQKKRKTSAASTSNQPVMTATGENLEEEHGQGDRRSGARSSGSKGQKESQRS